MDVQDFLATLSIDEATRCIPSPLVIKNTKFYFGFVKSDNNLIAAYRDTSGSILGGIKFTGNTVGEVYQNTVSGLMDMGIFPEEVLVEMATLAEESFEPQDIINRRPDVEWTDFNDISALQPGNLVRNKATNGVFFIQANYGTRATGSATCDVTNPSEWELLTHM